MFRIPLLILLGICVSLLGCASTKLATSGEVPTVSLCQSSSETLSTLVLWGPKWRPNQKEATRREAAVQQGLEDYFAQSGCFSKVEIHRLPEEKIERVSSRQELQALASLASAPPDRLLVVIVRELGPVIKFLSSPAMLEGGTEVVLELTAVNLQTAASPASFRIHWQNGGPLVIKGVKTLPDDMSAALGAAMSPGLRTE